MRINKSKEIVLGSFLCAFLTSKTICTRTNKENSLKLRSHIIPRHTHTCHTWDGMAFFRLLWPFDVMKVYSMHKAINLAN